MKQSDDIVIKKKNINDMRDEFLIPNVQKEGWCNTRIEYDYLEYLGSTAYILFKNNLPIGQLITTTFDSVVSFSFFIMIEEERGKGNGNILLDFCYQENRNNRLIGTILPELSVHLCRKYNLFKIQEVNRFVMKYNSKTTKTMKTEHINQLSFTPENFLKMKNFFYENYGYDRSKSVEYLLKNSIFLEYRRDDIEGMLCALRYENTYKVMTFIAYSKEVAFALFSELLNNLFDGEYTILLYSPSPNDKEMNELINNYCISMKTNEYILSILDSEKTTSYNKFYGLSLDTI